MQVLVTFEGSEQNMHDLISNLPQVVTNVGATFVDATRVDMSAPVEAPAEDVVPTEAPDESANVPAGDVTGGSPEEPQAGFLGGLSEEEKTMEKE